MSEIKIGDRARVSGFDSLGFYFDNQLCRVLETNINPAYHDIIKIDVDNFMYGVAMVHRKQCRKLVKKIKKWGSCLGCGGTGQWVKENCWACHGTGKTK